MYRQKIINQGGEGFFEFCMFVDKGEGFPIVYAVYVYNFHSDAQTCQIFSEIRHNLSVISSLWAQGTGAGGGALPGQGGAYIWKNSNFSSYSKLPINQLSTLNYIVKDNQEAVTIPVECKCLFSNVC